MITVMRRYRRVLQVGLLVVIAAFVITSVVVSGSGRFGGAPSADGIATSVGELETERAKLAERRARAVAKLPVVLYRRYESIRTRGVHVLARGHVHEAA